MFNLEQEQYLNGPRIQLTIKLFVYAIALAVFQIMSSDKQKMY